MKPILVIIDPDDAPHAFRLAHVCSATVRVAAMQKTTTLEAITKLARNGTFSAVMTTSQELLDKVLNTGAGTIGDYAGSIMYPFIGCEVPLLVLPSLKQLLTVPSAPFLFKRWISKLTHPEKWRKVTPFRYTLFDNSISTRDAEDYVMAFNDCSVIAIDIETTSFINDAGKWIPKITCVGFSGIRFVAGGYTTTTVVIPMTSEFNYDCIKRICENDSAKVMQNWKFDATYLLIWGITTRNVYFDTLSLGHARYSELPKNLAFNAAFYLRDVQFWKDDNTLSNMAEHYRYNARDAWVTANLFISQILEFPKYAIENYTSLFSVEPVCLGFSFEGLLIDAEKLTAEKTAVEAQIAELEGTLQHYLSSPNFNVGSHVQVKKLLNAFAAPLKFESSDDKHLAKFALTGPLNSLLAKLITDLREARKYYSTYLCARLLDGKLFYTINTAATETGRLASQSSSFSYIERIKRGGNPQWVNYGTQVQNIPPRYKKLVRAPEGWKIYELDYKQAESVCTAYLSRDEKLLNTIHTSPDFHCTNASMFFGIPFEQLFDVARGKKLNVPIRDIAKRVNHGANYNMGPAVLATTMGAENLYMAAKLLDLPAKWTLLEIAKYLLGCFDRAYPDIRGRWYSEITTEVQTTGRLTSAIGYTRLTFLKPWENKPALNALVAHGPQNLSVSILNRGLIQIDNELVGENFRLLAQIHDSVLCLVRDGHEHLTLRAAELLTRTVEVNGMPMAIQVDISKGSTTWK